MKDRGGTHVQLMKEQFPEDNVIVLERERVLEGVRE
jgi:hypothetical protein